jgi:hypothetical protein
MVGTIVANFIGAALDGYAFALLIPFLNSLFNQPQLPLGRGWVNDFLHGGVTPEEVILPVALLTPRR